MKRIFILWLLVCCASLSAYAADAPDKKKKARTAPASPKTVKSWMPEAFPQEIERLPAGYTGLNPLKFLTLFQAKVDALKKGEFETTEEHTQRTADKEQAIAPFNFKDRYAFQIKGGMRFKYNSDAQAYTIYNDRLCRGKIFEAEDLIYCDSIRAQEIEDHYSAQTTGGASLTITRTISINLGLMLERSSLIHTSKTIYGKISPYTDEEDTFMDYNDTLPVSLARARELKDRTLSVLFVGRVTAAQVDRDARGLDATFSFPYEFQQTIVRIPFEVRRVVYYVVETGEILGSKDF